MDRDAPQKPVEVLTPPRLTPVYVVGCILIAATVIGGYVFSITTLNNQAKDVRLVDLAVRQKLICRNIGQEIAYLEKIESPAELNIHLNSIHEAKVMLEYFHGELEAIQKKSKSSRKAPQSLRGYYQSVQPYFKAMSEGIDSLIHIYQSMPDRRRADQAALRLTHKVLIGEAGYSEGMDQLVGFARLYFNKHHSDMRRDQFLVLISVLGGLFLIAWFVFRPAVYHIHRTMKAHLETITELREEVDERQKIAEALRKSEDRYRLLFNCGKDAIFVHSLKVNKFIEINQVAVAKLGYSREELLQKTPLDIISPDEIGRFKYIRERLLVNNDISFKTNLIAKSGRRIPVEFDAHMFDFRGIPTILSIARDVSEKQEAERLQSALYRISERSSIIEDIQDFYRAIHRTVGDLLDVRNFYIALADSADDTLHCPYAVTDGDAGVGERHPAQALTEYVYETSEPLCVNRAQILEMIHNGLVKPFLNPPVSWLGVPLQNRQGVRGALVVQSYDEAHHFSEKDKAVLNYVGHNISNALEKKRQLAQINEERRWLTVTLNNIADAVITTDTEGRILLLNPVAENLLQVAAQQAEGMRIQDLFRLEPHPDEVKVLRNGRAAAVADPIGNVIRFGNTVAIPGALMKTPANPDREMSVALSAVPIKDEKEAVIGVVVAFHDITEKLKNERELQKAHKLESIGLLAGGIAHDFNNILTTILGNVSLAKEFSRLNEKSSSLLAGAEAAGERARDLTQQLLTFSKGGSPVKQATSLSEIVKEAIAFGLHGSTVSPEIIIDEDLWPAETDAGQISQVINNIVINAVHAMPGGGQIYADLDNFELDEPAMTDGVLIRPGQYVRITLRDSGVGISKEHLSRIFDPYFTTKSHGNGLGLATGYSIIKKHEGYITVVSEPPDGSTFSIYLPASPELTLSDGNEERVLKRGSGRVLVMDDEETIRELLEMMLSDLGYEAVTAENGEEAIAEYRSAMATGQKFDAVIMDLTIPGAMGGKEAIVDLQKLDPQVKAVVSSGYSNDPVMGEFEKYGFSARMPKPFNLHDVSSALARVKPSSD